MSNYLIVGAGFSGAVIARELAEAGHTVNVIDKRDHIAGNAYDYRDPETGILVHKYGPHLFHTKNDRVWQYLQKFASWTPYKHKVKAQLNDGRFVTLPVNQKTAAAVGGFENVLDVFFRPYTKKMWGVELDELDPDIINRVPIRYDDNEFYFPEDTHQALPLFGYTFLVEEILNHSNISVSLNTSFSKKMENEYDHVFNSMPIDEYYDFRYGELPYRSIKFHHKTVPMTNVLPTVTVNFTHDLPYTRVTEWRKLPFHQPFDSGNPDTILTFEEPCDYRDNNLERYYPVKDKDGVNRETYKKYASIDNPKVTFIGRCGMYVYIDMDQAINSALATVRKFLGP